MAPRKENEASNAHKEELNEKDNPDGEGGSMYMREEKKKTLHFNHVLSDRQPSRGALTTGRLGGSGG